MSAQPASESPMSSHLLAGKVRHRRARPFTYQLEHDVFYFALDLAELDVVAARLRLVGRNRRSIVGFRDADHLPTPATDVDADVRAHLRAEGEDPSGWRITLITNLRILGYVFNPASFFLCRDAGGVLRMVVVEVHNTHLERHLYTLRQDPSRARVSDDRFVGGMAKDFYVSPFIDMEGQYTVHVLDEPSRLHIAINERQGDAPVLATSLVLARRPLTDRMLVRMLLRHPLMTQRTMALIHLHALRLWRKGVRFQRHGEAVRAFEASRLVHGAPGHGGPASASHGTAGR